MTTLYLIRHAAADDAEEGQSDADRALTKDGVNKFREAARGIATVAADEPPQIIFTSPLLRARQTAELLAGAFGRRRPEVSVTPMLGPAGELPAFLRQVRRSKAAVVAAVGHEPTLSEWTAELSCGKRGRVLLKKGAAAVIELADSGTLGELIQLLQPRVLRKLAK